MKLKNNKKNPQQTKPPQNINMNKIMPIKRFVYGFLNSQ